MTITSKRMYGRVVINGDTIDLNDGQLIELKHLFAMTIQEAIHCNIPTRNISSFNLLTSRNPFPTDKLSKDDEELQKLMQSLRDQGLVQDATDEDEANFERLNEENNRPAMKEYLDLMISPSSFGRYTPAEQYRIKRRLELEEPELFQTRFNGVHKW